MSPTVLPMFPLGTVLFPSMLLPLRAFEPRYQALVRQCLDTDRQFGVVLIERGSEVGGGDIRTDVGCVASILQAELRSDGIWRLLTIGTNRVQITRWLPDDPFPQAEVQRWPDDPSSEDLECSVKSIEPQFRRVLALACELDEWSVPATVEVSDDPSTALYQMCAASPLGPFDRQQLLASSSASQRCTQLRSLLIDLESMLRSKIGSGS